jgi:hypothetical protein
MSTVTERPIKKHDFMTPADVLPHVEEFKALAITPNPLVGTWLNCDKATRGLIKLVISASGSTISVHGFGACVPTPCDWGTVPGKAYADNVVSSTAVAFTANFKFAFKETFVTGRLELGTLVVETFDHFTDGSGRADYFSREYMHL